MKCVLKECGLQWVAQLPCQQAPLFLTQEIPIYLLNMNTSTAVDRINDRVIRLLGIVYCVYVTCCYGYHSRGGQG